MTSHKSLHQLADQYRPRLFDRMEAVGVDDHLEVPSMYQEAQGKALRRLGRSSQESTWGRRDTDASIRQRETDAKWRAKQ